MRFLARGFLPGLRVGRLRGFVYPLPLIVSPASAVKKLWVIAVGASSAIRCFRSVTFRYFQYQGYGPPSWFVGRCPARPRARIASTLRRRGSSGVRRGFTVALSSRAGARSVCPYTPRPSRWRARCRVYFLPVPAIGFTLSPHSAAMTFHTVTSCCQLVNGAPVSPLKRKARRPPGVAFLLLVPVLLYGKARPHQSGAGARISILNTKYCGFKKARKALILKGFQHTPLNRVPHKPKPRPTKTKPRPTKTKPRPTTFFSPHN